MNERTSTVTRRSLLGGSLATSLNPHTNSQRTLRASSDGLYHAFKARLARMKAYAQEMDV